MTQIALFSDQPILLQGFMHALAPAGFEIVAAGPPLEATSSNVVESSATSTPFLSGDDGGSAGLLVLLDVTGGLTFEALGLLHAQFIGAKFVLWADNLPLDVVFKTLEFGVRGIIARTSSTEHLIDSLHKVAGGEMQIGFRSPHEVQQPKKAVTLTPREREIIGLLRQGLRNKQIGSEMGVTEGTVKIYLFRLFQKLGVRNRFDLARSGIAGNLFDPRNQIRYATPPATRIPGPASSPKSLHTKDLA